MLRFLAFSLVAVLVISILRMVIGLIGKGLSELVQPSASPNADPKRPGPVTGELKKDPVCGTYVSTATAFRRPGTGGETVYFCSAACRDRFSG